MREHMNRGFTVKPKSGKTKREGPLRIPLPFEGAVSDLLKVRLERKQKPKRNESVASRGKELGGK